jgi:hypothetical protein
MPSPSSPPPMLCETVIHILERVEDGVPPEPGSVEHIITCALLMKIFGRWPSMS